MLAGPDRGSRSLVGLAPAAAQTPPWVDPTLLDAAKKEGTLVVYSSTNEQEGLPLFKLFEQATGIKVQYVRGSNSVLTSRMSIEFRAGQHAYDIVHMTTINKLPQQMLAQYEPPEAKNISSAARDKDRRWYGVFANYNSPSYNTKMVKPEQLPKTYEEFPSARNGPARSPSTAPTTNGCARSTSTTARRRPSASPATW